MSKKEAIKWIKDHLYREEYDSGLQQDKAMKLAITALEHQQKYRWHDLRKEPSDLPSDNNKSDFFTVAVSGKDEDGIENQGFVTTAQYFYDGSWDVFKGLTVIGWKEIEPFIEPFEEGEG